METFQEQLKLRRFDGFLAASLLILASYSSTISANEKNQTLVLVGGALTTCSSMSAKNCQDKQQLSGKNANQYQLNRDTLNQVKLNWPNDNAGHRNKTLQVLATMARQHPSPYTKSDLLWAWRDLNNALLNQLTDVEYNFVIDSIEIPVVDAKQARLKEVVNTTLNSETAANDILDFISATAKVSATKPSLLAITASSRDPYESADFYEGLLDFNGIASKWLALTPALARAITSGECAQLTSIREKTMNVYNRDAIYPDRIKAELALCKQGVKNLVKVIESATGVMLNGGDQSLTHKVLFDEQGKPYPWTEALRSRPLLVGTSAGTAIQSGGKNQYGQVAMITNGTSLSALRDGAFAQSAPSERCTTDCDKGLSVDSLTYQGEGGLGSFNFGILDTHFSERDRTARLATLLDATKQPYGFGVDETTALVVINSGSSKLMTVIGKNGVVYLHKPHSAEGFNYSYWPVGTRVNITKDGFSINDKTITNALPKMKIPPLPMQRFTNIFTDTKLRSLTQAMCLTNDTQATAQQDEFSVAISGNEDSQFYRVNSSKHGCLVDNLAIKIKQIQ
ncbi:MULTISPECIES: cyanophycinase [unclassified Pseudoalteromonas]|uniref:cyanophycinase n=1 Tax=unclassified Pseudoalteromonas TaxID=194690 RepID=UPI000C07F3A1|nr:MULTISPECIES: cyanophycinase [unclassified Pseudoalteromonas]MDP2635632.1 cyanophycinase [Pseudoalteromonas sp. 1_MG-2023]PHN88877.1 cyanophycinase [Pseudoalteromonas sp. 3D05]